MAEKYMSVAMTRSIIGSVGAALNRADILNTFSSYMSLAGVQREAAQEALNRVDLSIRGLPIGLDEAAQRLRRYQMFLGDIGNATDLTIGVQKAITAGGASESMRQMAYLQLDRLITTGKLSTQRQWNSLIQGMGVSVRFLAQELGHGELNASEFVEALRTGAIPAQTFLRALMDLGKGTSEAGQKLDQALGIYKTTYESWLNNIQFAAKRGMANVINSLSDALESGTGRTTIQYMRVIRDTMNDTFSSASEFIRDGNLQPIFNSVGGLIESAKGLSAGEFGRSAVRYFAESIDLLSTALNKMDGSKISRFMAFASTIAGPLGKLFSAVSSGAPALMGVFQRFENYDFTGLVDSIVDRGKELSSFVESLLNLFSDNTMNSLLSFGLVWGKPLAATLQSIASALMFFGAPGVRAGIASLGSFLFTTPAGLAALGGGAILSQNYDITQQENADYNAWNEASGRSSATGAISASGITMGKAGAALDEDTPLGALLNIQSELALRRRMLLRQRVDAEQRLRDAQAAYDKEKEWQDALGDKNGLGLGTFKSSLLAEEKAVTTAKSDLANIDNALGEIDGYTVGIGDKIQDIRTHTTAAAEESKKVATAFDEIDFEAEDFLESIDKMREEVQKTFKGEKDEPFDFGSYVEERWDISKWISDYYNKNVAQNEWRDNVEKAKRLIAEHAKDPMYTEGITAIVNAGPDALAAYFSGRPDQQDAMRQEFFNNGSIADTIAAQVQAINAGTEAYKTDLINDTQSIEGAANDLADLLMDPFRHSKWYGYLHYNGHEPEGSRGFDYFNNVIANMGGVRPDMSSLVPDELTFEEFAKNYSKPFLDMMQGVVDVVDEKNPEIKDGMDETVKITGEGVKDIEEVLNKSDSSDAMNAYLNTIMQPLPGFQQSFAEAMRQAAQSGVDAFNGVITNFQPPTIPTTPGGGGAVRRPEYRSYGGLIYAANGTFIPIGTDTVPAMLTPGEYVQRKAAVDAFGRDFMDKVNALNIKGAIHSLFHRYPSLAGMTYVANDSRSYDNHAAVHMTINNASQHYTQRIADRWVRAL